LLSQTSPAIDNPTPAVWVVSVDANPAGGQTIVVTTRRPLRYLLLSRYPFPFSFAKFLMRKFIKTIHFSFCKKKGYNDRYYFFLSFAVASYANAKKKTPFLLQKAIKKISFIFTCFKKYFQIYCVGKARSSATESQRS
jgi:hypothetical protein